MAAMPAGSSAVGSTYSLANGTALGAQTGRQPPSWTLTAPEWPAQGRYVLALRPACASCTPAIAPCSSTNRTIRASAGVWASLHKPRSCGLMRPSAVTAVASVMTSPAPPTARDPRWTTCQSLAKPSVLEYSHTGDTAIRLRSVTPRMVSGENRLAGPDGGGAPSWGRAGAVIESGGLCE